MKEEHTVIIDDKNVKSHWYLTRGDATKSATEPLFLRFRPVKSLYRLLNIPLFSVIMFITVFVEPEFPVQQD